MIEHYTRSEVFTQQQWAEMSPDSFTEIEDRISSACNESIMSVGLPLTSIAMVTRIVVGTDEHGVLRPFAQATRIEFRISKAVET